MKTFLTLLVFIAAVITYSSCKKDNVAPKPQFVDIEFSIYSLRPPGDTTQTDVTYSNTIILKSDYTWTIDLGGAKSNGTYTLTPTTNQQGDIKFTIVNWTDFTLNPILSNKLKSALQAVRRYGYSLQSQGGFNNFLVENYKDDYFPFVTTYKK